MIQIKMNIKLIDYFDEKNFKLIRNNGLSQNKIKSIMGAKEAINNGMKKEDLTWALFNSTEFLFVQ